MHQPVHRNRKSKYSQEKKEAEFKENNVKYCIHKHTTTYKQYRCKHYMKLIYFKVVKLPFHFSVYVYCIKSDNMNTMYKSL